MGGCVCLFFVSLKYLKSLPALVFFCCLYLTAFLSVLLTALSVSQYLCLSAVSVTVSQYLCLFAVSVSILFCLSAVSVSVSQHIYISWDSDGDRM